LGVRFTLWAVDAERLLDVLTVDEVSEAQKNSWELQTALRRVSEAVEARSIVQLLLDGHRRWWIGSLIESLRQSPPWLLNQSDVEHAESLLAFMLRGAGCGTRVRDASTLVSGSSFPITPRSDSDLLFAVLSPSDFQFLRLFLHERLQDADRRFASPSGPVGIAPGSDVEWDVWVREAIREIAGTPLKSQAPSLVSFLG
jgi:hypothetical protein